MILKHFFLVLFLVSFCLCSSQTWVDCNKNGKKDIYEDASYTIDERVEDLLERMSLEEKQGQLLMDLGWQYYDRQGKKVFLSDYARQAIEKKKIGSLWCYYRTDPWSGKDLDNGLYPGLSVSAYNGLQRYMIDSTRLGIPMILAEECMHGIMQTGSTVFPTGIGQGATWNPELIEKMAGSIGREAIGQGINICFGPILDIAKDPRWSRVEESYGEDGYLVSCMGEGFVKGLKKDGKKIFPTLKHFAAYGISEGGHNAGSAHLGLRELNSEYLPPFRVAIEAGANLVMSSYNDIDGVACTANPYLLEEVLRKRWGFKGVTISDLHSIGGLLSHGIAKDLKQATKRCIEAGMDLDLSATDYYDNLAETDTALINRSVRRVLRLKFEAGLFDNPFIEDQDGKIYSESSEKALQVAQESLVLLKNEEKTLPLDKEKKTKIALIGPNADSYYNLLGDYTGVQDIEKGRTIKKVLSDFCGQNKNIAMNYAKGCSIRDTSRNGFALARQIAEKSDLIVLCLGGSSSRYDKVEYENTGAAKVDGKRISDITCGEGFDRSSLDLPGVQRELLSQMIATGKPIVLLLINGRPIVLDQIKDSCKAILECFYPGSRGAEAIVHTLFGKNNPSGHLPVSFPRSVGALPCCYNTKQVGNRSDYLEGSAKALYPFGYGLSYTDFAFKLLQVRLENQGSDSVCVVAECEVENVGKYDGYALVQIYSKKTVGDYVSNVKTLCAFAKPYLRKGEKQKVVLKANNSFFREWNSDATEFYLSKGEYKIMIGSDSDNVIEEKTIEVR